MIRWAGERALGLVAVCQALKDEMARLGMDPEKIRVLRNGVDLDMFRPVAPDLARARLGLSGSIIASVGHLIPRKAHDLVIRAVPKLPAGTLLVRKRRVSSDWRSTWG
jgi:glycosyltransferase involved in cell wall biosynthesis